jgi:putative CocE/NonD family hydrolase
LRQLPLLTLDEKLGCGVVPAYRDYVTHETRDPFWQALSWRETLGQTTAPTLLTAGWYDYYAGENFLNYQALCQSPDPKLASRHRVLVGPWTHGISGTTQLGELDFGPASLEEGDSTTRWLECLLRGGDAAQFQEAPIRLFVMGENQWRDEWEWPLRRTRFTPFYLHSAGAANTSRGDGVLCRAPQESAQPDHYVYDPDNPTPTLGGNHSVGPYNPGLYELALPGPYDQRATEARDDVLVYTGEALEQDMEITGPVTLKLYAASSAPDTDFVARLCDLYPDGRSINITEGVIRARFHERAWQRPQLIEPGRLYEYTVELHPTSMVFKRGHRLRLQVTSSNFPLWDRNLNTGAPLATGAEFQKAAQTIYHDAAHPSHLILPVIPRS